MSKLIKCIPMTASWSTALPDSYARIGISRGRPRRQSGYRVYSPLAPGVWWNRVDLSEFYKLYMEQLAELDAARGPDFDRLFLTYMIQHHQGALTMVHDLFDTYGAAQGDAIFKIASDIGADQTSEIDRMQTMLRAMVFGTPGSS